MKRASMISRSSQMAAAALLSLAAASAANAALIYNAYLISPVDTLPTLPTYTVSTTKQEASTFNGANAAGQAIGTTNIYNSTPSSVASQAWLYDPSLGATGATTFLGLTGGIYNNSAGLHSSTSRAINTGGQIVGTSATYSGTTNLGTEVWFYSPLPSPTTTLIDMTTLNSYSANSTSPTTYNFSGTAGSISRSAIALNDSGLVAGTVNTYGTSSNFSTGTIGWLFNSNTGALTQVGVTPQAVGFISGKLLTSTTVNAINSSGVVVGNSTRYINSTSSTTAGQDAWYYDPGAASPSTVLLGLFGAANNVDQPTYTYSTAMKAVTYSGLTYSATVSGNLNQFSQAVSINANGLVLGTSRRYSGTTNIGNDIWVYNKNTAAYTIIGLDGPGYDNSTTKARSTFVGVMNDSGMVTGTTSRLAANDTTSLGQDAWVYNAGDGSTLLLNPPAPSGYAAANQFYTSPAITAGTFRFISASRINSQGLVQGYVSRYTATGGTSSSGQDAFIYDPAGNGGLGQYYIIAPVDPTTFTLANTSVNYLSDTGVVLGSYSRNVAGARSPITYAYVWTEATGAIDLNIEVPNLATFNWTALESGLYLSSNGTIYGTGLRTTNAAGGTPPTSSGEIFAAVIVPEPATAGLMAFAGMGMLVKRRRRKN